MNLLPFVIAISDDGQSPKIVHEVDSNLMYLGYCTPDCTGEGDAKWLIKRVKTENGIQTIWTANGSHAYNQKWTDRANASVITYKPTERWLETESA